MLFLNHKTDTDKNKKDLLKKIKNHMIVSILYKYFFEQEYFI